LAGNGSASSSRPSWVKKGKSEKIDGGKFQKTSDNEVDKIVDKVIKENEKAVSEYKAGDEKVINFLVGQVMRLSNKRADFKTAKDLLESKLK